MFAANVTPNFGETASNFIRRELPHIVIVEDDVDINDLLKHHFESTGEYNVTSLYSGEGAVQIIAKLCPDLVILDQMLPGKFGTQILSELRKMPNHKNLPVLMLTAKSSEEDKIKGLELGADDYVTKPFSPREVLLRVRSVTKRQGPAAAKNEIIQIGAVTLNPAEHRATVSGTPVALTAIEFKFLAYLAARPGRVVARERLLKDVWEYTGEPSTRTIDTHVKRLRQKLGLGEILETVHGVGYRLSLDNPLS